MRIRSRGSSDCVSCSSIGSRATSLLLAMFATMAAIYVAGRLWQDAEIRLRLRRDLDERSGLGQAAVSVADTLKIISCREQQKKLLVFEVDRASARKEGFVGKGSFVEHGDNRSTKKLLAMLGIMTTFGCKKNRDAIRMSWMPKGGEALRKLEEEMGIVARFVIGGSANQGDSSDSEIEYEDWQNHDFLVLVGRSSGGKELPEKTKSFFVHDVGKWDAEFYAKVKSMPRALAHFILINRGYLPDNSPISINVPAHSAEFIHAAGQGYLDIEKIHARPMASKFVIESVIRHRS